MVLHRPVGKEEGLSPWSEGPEGGEGAPLLGPACSIERGAWGRGQREGPWGTETTSQRGQGRAEGASGPWAKLRGLQWRTCWLKAEGPFLGFGAAPLNPHHPKPSPSSGETQLGAAVPQELGLPKGLHSSVWHLSWGGS